MLESSPIAATRDFLLLRGGVLGSSSIKVVEVLEVIEGTPPPCEEEAESLGRGGLRGVVVNRDIL